MNSSPPHSCVPDVSCSERKSRTLVVVAGYVIAVAVGMHRPPLSGLPSRHPMLILKGAVTYLAPESAEYCERCGKDLPDYHAADPEEGFVADGVNPGVTPERIF